METDFLWAFSQDCFFLLGQSFKLPDLQVIPQDHGGRPESFRENLGKNRQKIFYSLGEGLEHEMGAIAVDDQRRNPLRFPINQPVGIGPFNYSLAVAKSFGHAVFPKIRANRLLAPGDQSEGDLGTVAIETLSQKFSFFRFQDNDAARGGVLDFFQVVPKNPGVSPAKPGKPFGGKNKGSHPNSNLPFI